MNKPMKKMECAITFLSANEGGRKAPLHLRTKPFYYVRLVPDDVSLQTFNSAGMLEQTPIVFMDGPEGIIEPNKEVILDATLLYYPLPCHKGLQAGVTFTLREGLAPIAHGKILKLVDK